MEKRTFDIKDGAVDVIMVCNSDRKGEYSIVALSDERQVGYCDFWLSDGCAHIGRIVVTDASFLSRGVGHIMLTCMEQFCHEHDVTAIYGYYLPRVYPNSSEITSKFYSRHGFVGDEMYDYCDRDEICLVVHNRGEDFHLTPICDDELYDKIQTYNYQTCDLFSSNRDIPSDLEL